MNRIVCTHHLATLLLSFDVPRPRILQRGRAAQYPAGLPHRSCASCDTNDSSPSAQKAKNDWQSLCWSAPSQSVAPTAAPASSTPTCAARLRTAARLPRSQNIETAPCTTSQDKLPPRRAPPVLPPIPHQI